MTELDRRRPQSVAVHEVDWEAVLRYLNLNPRDPKAQALHLVCDRYGLDPLLGHASIYEGKPYIHYAGYLFLGNSHPQYDGAECVSEWETETHYHATVRVHRKDRTYAFERTGRSAKVKPKKGGGSYVDQHADAKAFAQAHRRALRLAFNVAVPEPDDHGGEQPAPEPVVEVARMVEATSQTGGAGGTGGPALAGQPAPSEMSGAGEREPTVSSDGRDLRHDPAPDPTSGARREASALVRDDPVTAPDPTSDPWGLSPLAPRADPSSPPLSADTGKGSGGGDSKVVGSEVHQDPPARPDTTLEGVPEGDGGTGADSTPPVEQRSPVVAWCLEHNIRVGDARLYLAHAHKEHFGRSSEQWLRNLNDVAELTGDEAARALVYLDAQFGDVQEGG